MKIGINLVGITYGEVGDDINKNRHRDWRKSVNEFYQFIVNPLKEQGHEIFFYLYTYQNENHAEVLKDYPSVKCTTTTIEEILGSELSKRGMQRMAVMYVNSLEQLKDEKLDLIISTRFDLKFLKNPFESYEYDFSKINFLWKEPEYHNYPIINDTFIVFPYNMLQTMLDGIHTLELNPDFNKIPGMHNLYLSLLEHTNPENVQWVRDEYVTTELNDLYKITRQGWPNY